MTRQAIHRTAAPPPINATAGAHIIELYCGARATPGTPCYAAVVVMKGTRPLFSARARDQLLPYRARKNAPPETLQ